MSQDRVRRCLLPDIKVLVQKIVLFGGLDVLLKTRALSKRFESSLRLYEHSSNIQNMETKNFYAQCIQTFFGTLFWYTFLKDTERNAFDNPTHGNKTIAQITKMFFNTIALAQWNKFHRHQ